MFRLLFNAFLQCLSINISFTQNRLSYFPFANRISQSGAEFWIVKQSPQSDAILHCYMDKEKHKSPHWNRKNIFGCNLHCRIRFFTRIDFTLFVFIHSIRNFENLHSFAGLFHCSNAHTIHARYALGTCQAIIIYFVCNENSRFFPGKLISNSFFIAASLVFHAVLCLHYNCNA